MTSASTDHRRDIQGLRAVAVLTVMASHLGVGLLAGGFVGVDVFFVISGFLITQLMLREVTRSSRLSLTGFYVRRARRILPAATLVLVATAVASALWLGPVRGPDAFVDITWAAFFAANIRAAVQGTDYFAQDLSPSPVQHYWSLAVEEQFYLVWPLLLLAVLVAVSRVSRRRDGADDPAECPIPLTTIAGVLLTLTVASLLWSVHTTASSPATAYFSSLARAWELGVGALGAVCLQAWHARSGARPPRRGGVEIVALLGVGAVASACLRFDASTAFPGTAAVVPVLGSAAILVVGGLHGRPTWVARALSVRPMQAIGDWSYSLYLWHWPLLVIPAVHLDRTLRAGEKAAVVALTFVLAAATTRFVEAPFRRGRDWALPRRALVLYPTTVAIVLSSTLAARAYVEHSDHGGHGAAITLPGDWREEFDTRDRAVALVAASVRAARHREQVPRDLRPALTDLLDSTADLGGCDYRDDTVRRLCPRGDTSSDKTIVLMGDSHARHWIPAFDAIAERAGYRTYYLSKSQCVASLVTSVRSPSGKPFTACTDFKAWALDEVKALHPDLVVVSSSPGITRGVYVDGRVVSDPADSERLVTAGNVDLLTRLRATSERTVLLADVPTLDGDPGTCLATGTPRLGACLFRERSSHVRAVEAQLAAAETAGVESVPTAQWFCHDGACPSVIGRTIPYRDGGHITTEYSAGLADSLARALGLALP